VRHPLKCGGIPRSTRPRWDMRHRQANVANYRHQTSEKRQSAHRDGVRILRAGCRFSV